MSTLEICLGVALIVFSIALLMVVLMQEGHQKSPGIVTGNSDTFLSKNKGRSIDAFLERWTKFISVGFFILVIATNAVLFFSK